MAGNSSNRQSRRWDGVAEKLSALPALPRASLVEHWIAAYGQPPPKGLSRRLLEYAAAYHLQARAAGGLKPGVRRKLRELAAAGAPGPRSPARPAREKTLMPGARLVREWHGRTYIVEVLESGFQCDGTHYRSLSEVARAITGARWSGPRFFDL